MRNIEKILNIETKEISVSTTDVASAVQTVENNFNMVFDSKDFDEDFLIVRDNLKELIIETKRSVQRLSLIADDSEKAPFYAALGGLTKTLLEINRQLLEIHQTKKTLFDDKNKPTFPNNNNTIGNIEKAIFVGKTADLKKMIRDEASEK